MATSSTERAGADACLPAGACVEADLGWALGVVFRRYVKASSSVLACVPGGPRGYQVLATAAGEGSRHQLALAQQLGVDRTVMTYLLDDLEREGLVERQPDPKDRRARRIVLTERGRSTLAGLEGGLAAAENQVLGALDDADRATLRTLLQRVAVQADGVDPVVNTCDVAEELDAEVQRTGTNPDS